MKDKIIEVLKKSSYPMRARYIARHLGVDRTTINRILYANLNNPFFKNENFEWGISLNSRIYDVDNFKLESVHRNWRELYNYLLEMYQKAPEFFEIDDSRVQLTEMSSQIIVNIEIYVIHLLIFLTFEQSNESIDEEDIYFVINYITPSFFESGLDYKSMCNIFESKFESRERFILKLLHSIIRFDDAFETRKVFVFIEKIESVIYSWKWMIEELIDSNIETSNIIDDLKKFVSEEYDYTAGLVNSFDKCFKCGNWVSIYDLDMSIFGDEYCIQCRYSGDYSFHEYENGEFFEIEEDD